MPAPVPERASKDLDALGVDIAALADAGDPAPQWDALLALLDGECFALHGHVRMFSDDDAPTSGLSLRTWWKHGGEPWTRQFLELDTTWERPSVRRVLAVELLPDHPCVRRAVCLGSRWVRVDAACRHWTRSAASWTTRRLPSNAPSRR